MLQILCKNSRHEDFWGFIYLQFALNFGDVFFSVFMLQVTESTDFNELAAKEPWLLSGKLVVKPDMLFGKRGKSGLVALNLDLAQVATFVKERLGKEVLGTLSPCD